MNPQTPTPVNPEPEAQPSQGPQAPPTPQQAVPAPEAPIPPENGRDSKGKWIVFWVVLIVILAVIFASLFSVRLVNKSDSRNNTNSSSNIEAATPISAEAKQVGDQIVNDIQSNNASDIYSRASSDFTSTVSEEDFKSGIAEISSAYASGTETFTGDQQITGEGQTYMILLYTIKTANQDLYLRIALIEKDGKWEMYNLDVSTKPLGELTSEEINGAN